MTLWFDVMNSPALSPGQKELVLRRLQNRIDKNGVLRVISQRTRSQAANRELAIERFVELLHEAIKQVPIRKKTRVSKGAKLRRLEEKKQHGILKSKRSKKVPPRGMRIRGLYNYSKYSDGIDWRKRDKVAQLGYPLLNNSFFEVKFGPLNAPIAVLLQYHFALWCHKENPGLQPFPLGVPIVQEIRVLDISPRP